MNGDPAEALPGRAHRDAVAPANSMGDAPDIDVLGLGAVAVDEVLWTASETLPNSKSRITGRDLRLGGTSAAALAAAARLGAKAVLAAQLGGRSAAAAFARSELARAGVELIGTRGRAADDSDPARGEPIRCVVIASPSGSRTVLFDLDGVEPTGPEHVPPALVARAKVLFVDHFGIEAMLPAAREARRLGRPVVADFESEEGPRFTEVLRIVDHLIVPVDLALRITGSADPRAACAALWNEEREITAVTVGADGLWFLDRTSREPVLIDAFRVDAIDTCGCGDVFHGSYASALARGRAPREAVLIARAAASIHATRRTGPADGPTLDDVAKFLAAGGLGGPTEPSP
jgi:sugar/nucleoside kinase (ribokinase family)